VDGVEIVSVNAVKDDFEFDAETDELVNQEAPPGEERPDVLTFATEGDVDPYSSVDVEFTFRPRQPGKLGRSLEFHFEGSGVVVDLEIEATSLRVPIYVENRMIDLKCCVIDKLYVFACCCCNVCAFVSSFLYGFLTPFFSCLFFSLHPQHTHMHAHTHTHAPGTAPLSPCATEGRLP
jgi:hypothetical protein